ncbi:MAG: response regulator transcription factor [Anaerolineae bacterium]|nr:response regulator transcription factor [Anaerolineae bacterium]
MSTKKIRILVVDDQNVVRDCVVTMLSLQSDMEVVGEAQNGIQAVEIAKQSKPDVVLLDMVMPLQDGLTTIPKLKEVHPDICILILTSFAASDLVYKAIKAGALGYLLKDATCSQLTQSIREVAEGKASIQPAIAIKVIQKFDESNDQGLMVEALTQRELETLKLIARGFSNQEIALSLHVHERTIAKYVSSVLKKLQVSNRTQAALYAVRKGIAAVAAS